MINEESAYFFGRAFCNIKIYGGSEPRGKTSHLFGLCA